MSEKPKRKPLTTAQRKAAAKKAAATRKKNKALKEAAALATRNSTGETLAEGSDDRRTRDADIFRSWLRGLSYETLGSTYGLEPKYVATIINAQKERAQSVIGQDPASILEEHIMKIDAAIDELAIAAANEKGSGRINAITARVATLKHRFETLQEVRVVNLGTIAINIDMREIGIQIVQTLQDKGVDDPELMEQLADVIEGKGRELPVPTPS